jgi:hypothetical protein
MVLLYSQYVYTILAVMHVCWCAVWTAWSLRGWFGRERQRERERERERERVIEIETDRYI